MAPYHIRLIVYLLNQHGCRIQRFKTIIIRQFFLVTPVDAYRAQYQRISILIS